MLFLNADPPELEYRHIFCYCITLLHCSHRRQTLLNLKLWSLLPLNVKTADRLNKSRRQNFRIKNLLPSDVTALSPRKVKSSASQRVHLNSERNIRACFLRRGSREPHRQRKRQHSRSLRGERQPNPGFFPGTQLSTRGAHVERGR